MRFRSSIIALTAPLAVAATMTTAWSGAAAADPGACTFDRRLTGVTVTCPAAPPRWGTVDVGCTGAYLTYGLGFHVGPYRQWSFGNLSRGVTVTCLNGYPNTGLGIVTDVGLR
ncbi:hypothetical protein [Nocardia sp. NPDC003345]